MTVLYCPDRRSFSYLKSTDDGQTWNAMFNAPNVDMGGECVSAEP
ncbi:MAG: hypothetical protein ABI183_17745 [Polyangiaceae bacterium]